MDTIDIQNSKLKIQNIAKQLHIFRLDHIHPIISGNKWFKLKHNLAFAKENNYKSILTFGGAYSNHLIATAAAAKEFDLESIGIVRGLHAKENLTLTLQHCESLNMQLQFITKEEYDLKEDKTWLENLSKKYPEAYIIPEGGKNELGIKGVEEIAQLIPDHYTHVAISIGTGTTFTGIRNALDEKISMLGFAPMKNGKYLADQIQPTKDNWQLIDDYHFGGFGKWNDKLIDFINEFYRVNNIPLDIVYTSKMMYGLQQMISNNFFDADAKILCIHTGGLQGNVSVEDKLCFKIPE